MQPQASACEIKPYGRRTLVRNLKAAATFELLVLVGLRLIFFESGVLL